MLTRIANGERGVLKQSQRFVELDHSDLNSRGSTPVHGYPALSHTHNMHVCGNRHYCVVPATSLAADGAIYKLEFVI